MNPIVVSVDGSFFAAQAHAQGAERRVRVWDTESLEVRSEFSISQRQVVVAAGPTWLVVYDIPSGALFIHDVDSGEVVAEPRHPHPFNIPGNVVSPDGSLLLSADLDGRVVVFESSTWETVASWQAHDTRMEVWSVPLSDPMSQTRTRLPTASRLCARVHQRSILPPER